MVSPGEIREVHVSYRNKIEYERGTTGLVLSTFPPTFPQDAYEMKMDAFCRALKMPRLV